MINIVEVTPFSDLQWLYEGLMQALMDYILGQISRKAHTSPCLFVREGEPSKFRKNEDFGKYNL